MTTDPEEQDQIGRGAKRAFRPRDLVVALAGAAAALGAGAVLGGSMRPQLAVGDRMAGPRVDVPVRVVRGPETPAPDPGVAAYGGALPDYVVGTDSLRPPEPDPEDAMSADASYPDDDGYAADRGDADAGQASAGDYAPTGDRLPEVVDAFPGGPSR